ncbi:hypothetical protein [Kitasatospora sp. NPDC086791]|uniref:hypothetical protein n=1 Tax=Kitasatospora sp. NPDC086791 TaxID=3155178 RepID=UPI0034191D59
MNADHDQIAAEEAEWQRTGRIRCSDCHTMVTTRTLETLPDHSCTRRQAARGFIAHTQERDHAELERLRDEACVRDGDHA